LFDKVGGRRQLRQAVHNAETGSGVDKMAGQQNEGQGPSKVAMVLPDVPEAMP